MRWGDDKDDSEPRIELVIGELRAEVSLLELARVADIARMSVPPLPYGGPIGIGPIIGSGRAMPPFVHRR